MISHDRPFGTDVLSAIETSAAGGHETKAEFAKG
jgi:hypothetical protein